MIINPHRELITSGLDLWFDFSQGSGTTLSDISGNGKNFTLLNMESGDWGSGVLSFGGTDECARYTGDAITTTVGSFVGRLKISDIAQGAVGNILGYGGAAQTNAAFFTVRIHRTAANVRWFYINERHSSDANSSAYGFTSTPLGDGNYHTYGISCDGSAATAFYLDGVAQTAQTFGTQGERKRWVGSVNPTSQTYTSVAALRFNGTDAGFAIMDADDIRLYSRALSADEHAAIHAGRG